MHRRPSRLRRPRLLRPPLCRPPPPAAAPAASASDRAPRAAADASATASSPPAARRRPPRPPSSRLRERAPVGKVGPWLRDALIGLAADEPDIAELIVVGLLPLQAGLVKGALAYELAIDGGDDASRRPRRGPRAPRARRRRRRRRRAISGPLTALVPLATGGAGRRLPGARIDQPPPVRRLLKARRRPLGLAELAAAGVAPSPGLLLTVLARAVDPRWTPGHPLTVDVAPEGADRWRVIASGHGPLAIFPAEGAPPAPATLRTSAGRLPAVLAGTSAAGDAVVEGDVRAVRTLLSWLDRAQRAGR